MITNKKHRSWGVLYTTEFGDMEITKETAILTNIHPMSKYVRPSDGVLRTASEILEEYRKAVPGVAYSIELSIPGVGRISNPRKTLMTEFEKLVRGDIKALTITLDLYQYPPNVFDGGYTTAIEVAEKADELMKPEDFDTQKRGFNMLESDEE